MPNRSQNLNATFLIVCSFKIKIKWDSNGVLQKKIHEMQYKNKIFQKTYLKNKQICINSCEKLELELKKRIQA